MQLVVVRDFQKEDQGHNFLSQGIQIETCLGSYDLGVA